MAGAIYVQHISDSKVLLHCHNTLICAVLCSFVVQHTDRQMNS